jgi:dihydroorotate dehydrogenase (fumarate)
MIDLETNYLGLRLKNPIVASASPLCDSLDNIKLLEDHGIAAVVLPSLFEEQLTMESEMLDADLSRGTESFAESLNFFPTLMMYNLGPDGYLELIRKAKASVGVPVIGSLNGESEGGWIRYAREMEQAGADAVELNIYSIVIDPERTSEQVERGYDELVRAIKNSVSVPVAVKLSPFFSAPANMAKRLDAAGADALVLFNRFYQPDLDLESLEVVPSLTLSRPEEMLLRLHWVAVVFGHVQADLAITGGVHSAIEVIKAVMAGARAVMMTSALIENGLQHLGTTLSALNLWMEEHEYESIRQMCGSMSLRNVPNPAAYERSNYMRVLSSYTLRDSVQGRTAR